MQYRSELSPLWSKFFYLVPLFALFLIVTSPVWVVICSIYEARFQIKEAFKSLFDFLVFNIEDDLRRE